MELILDSSLAVLIKAPVAVYGIIFDSSASGSYVIIGLPSSLVVMKEFNNISYRLQ